MLCGLLCGGGGARPPFDIWFSRNIQYDHLQYWMVVVKYHKLRVVRMPEGDFQLYYEYEPGWTADLEIAKPEPRGQRTPGSPNNYAILRIGYTDTWDEDVTRFIAEVRAAHSPPDRLSWMECQIMLRRFVDLIVSRRDEPARWNFFIENTDVNRCTVEQLPTTDEMRRHTEHALQSQARHIPDIEYWNRWQYSYLQNQNQNQH